MVFQHRKQAKRPWATTWGQLDVAWMLYGLPIGGNTDWLMWLKFMSEGKGVMK